MRVANWQARLAEEIQRSESMQFEWGVNDCCQFVARVAAAITECDPRDNIFPQYSSEAGAQIAIEEHGGLEGIATLAFGEPKHPAFATDGDCVLCDFGNGPQPAIVTGVYCRAPALRGGLEMRLVSTATMAWSI